MHLADALSVLENYEPERLHNIIADIFHMVLEGALMFPPHALFQIEP